MKTDRCSHDKCGAPIIWCETAKLKMMPIDAGAGTEGQWRIEQTPGATPKTFFVPRDERAGRNDLHTSHFATCQFAADFSRRATKVG